jgi:hypothetical protein
MMSKARRFLHTLETGAWARSGLSEQAGASASPGLKAALQLARTCLFAAQVSHGFIFARVTHLGNREAVYMPIFSDEHRR